MEADWELEIGGDAPVIEASWPGFVDLQADPARVQDLVECRRFPALADALTKLNGPTSSLWTSKVDVFVPEQINRDELDVTGDDVQSGLACYIDWLPRNDLQWSQLSDVEFDCRRLCDRLHVIELRSCRVDLVIRGAYTTAVKSNFGVTAYLSACGKDADAATVQLSKCLAAFVKCVVLEG